jgi:hypothetical protein
VTLYIFFDRIDEFITTNNIIKMECQLSIYEGKKHDLFIRFAFIILTNKFIFKEVNKVMKFHVEFSDKKIKLKREKLNISVYYSV